MLKQEANEQPMGIILWRKSFPIAPPKPLPPSTPYPNSLLPRGEPVTYWADDVVVKKEVAMSPQTPMYDFKTSYPDTPLCDLNFVKNEQGTSHTLIEETFLQESAKRFANSNLTGLHTSEEKVANNSMNDELPPPLSPFGINPSSFFGSESPITPLQPYASPCGIQDSPLLDFTPWDTNILDMEASVLNDDECEDAGEDEGEDEGDTKQDIGMDTTLSMPSTPLIAHLRPRRLAFGKREEEKKEVVHNEMLAKMEHPVFMSSLLFQSIPIWDDEIVQSARRARALYAKLYAQRGENFFVLQDGRVFPNQILDCLQNVFEWPCCKLEELREDYKILQRFTVEAVLFKHLYACSALAANALPNVHAIVLKNTFIFLRDVFFPACLKQ